MATCSSTLQRIAVPRRAQTVARPGSYPRLMKFHRLTACRYVHPLHLWEQMVALPRLYALRVVAHGLEERAVCRLWRSHPQAALDELYDQSRSNPPLYRPCGE